MKAKNIDYIIAVYWKGICPHCGKEVEVHYGGSPYSAIADDPPDEQCPECEKFFTLNFYE